MPSRLALLGAKEGPWIDISRVKNPVLHIVGLPQGSRVRVVGEHTLPCEFESNGHHELPPHAWVRVFCDAPPGHRTICVFLQKAA